MNETATQMTARVIHDVDADILGVVEAEDRPSLLRFNNQLLKPVGSPYEHIMLVDGNDERAIDVGLLARTSNPIESIVSHVDDSTDGRRIFSRDCPEYTVRTASGATILVMLNHLKSKGFGSKKQSDERRREQAKRVREIYDSRRAEGIDLIAIMGDMNDTPDSDALAPLVRDGSDLVEISACQGFDDGGRPGTYGNGTKSNKIDYILLSPALAAHVRRGGVHRLGVWGGKNGELFPHYPEITSSAEAASDHAAIWADIDI